MEKVGDETRMKVLPPWWEGWAISGCGLWTLNGNRGVVGNPLFIKNDEGDLIKVYISRTCGGHENTSWRVRIEKKTKDFVRRTEAITDVGSVEFSRRVV